jgi:hypothetical protein
MSRRDSCGEADQKGYDMAPPAGLCPTYRWARSFQSDVFFNQVESLREAKASFPMEKRMFCVGD